MTDWATSKSEQGGAIDVEREWNPGGVGNQLGDDRETSDETWNPGGVGNATEDEIVDQDEPDAGQAAGE